ncbi:MAG: hypothetical protein R2814_06065 [Flavobacteriaceae bacterium]
MGQTLKINKMEFVKKEIEKSKGLSQLLELIASKRGELAEFGMEIKVFKDGKELKP